MRYLFLIFICLCSLAACKRGFEVSDTPPKEKSNYSGPTQNAWWQLSFTGSGDNYELIKRSSPGSASNIYTLKGTYERLDSGYIQLSITSNTGSDVEGSSIVGLELGDEGFILYPFDKNENELIALVPKAECPTSNIRGMGLFLERVGDATLTNVAWLGDFLFNTNERTANLVEGIALDDNFTSSNTLSEDSGSCSGGIVQRNSGNHYLAENSALIEFDSTDYGRLLSLPSRSLSQIEDLNAEEYRGFLRDFGATSSANTSYLISANCTASDNLSTGDCNIFLVSDYILPALESQRRYHINFDSELNKYSVNGLVTGKITKDTEPFPNAITNIACSANSNFRSANKTYKLLHCNAQSAVDRSKLLHLILLKTE